MGLPPALQDPHEIALSFLEKSLWSPRRPHQIGLGQSKHPLGGHRLDSLTLLTIAAGAFLIAGIVKGAVGLGLPTTSLGLLTVAVHPRTAIALVLIPMFVSNIWQLYRAGDGGGALRRYAPYVIALVAVAGLTVPLTAGTSERVLFGLLGVMFLAFVALQVTRWAPHLPERLDRPAQIATGAISGMCGGLVGVWAPPMAVYLAARGVNKDEFVRASGLILCLGSVPLILGYLRQGYLTAELTLISGALLIPTFAGFALGEAVRGKLSEEAFRRMLLVFFALMGLNLLRRAVL